MFAEIADTENLFRVAVFAGVLLSMLCWELLAPRRVLGMPRAVRWFSNFGLGALNRLFLQVLPLSAVGLYTTQSGWGLMPLLTLPLWLEAALCLAAFDCAVYLQHRLLHAVPWLWRLHRMHHADTDFDTSTGVRFHPLEALFSMLVKMLVMVGLGAPVAVVILFEVLLNATSLFNHGNVRLPAALDRLLRKVIVTPDMHRVHHSADSRELNHNFGFNLAWWDYLFGTYRAQPAAGHRGMRVGLDRFRGPGEQQLHRLLLQPFR